MLLFLQTKELIAEIELLEEEIANREQHVLSLYRSIFDQCVSGPSSGQSSGISSPFHIMTSVSESGRTKNMLKTKIKHESFSSETLDVRSASLASDPRKVKHTKENIVSLNPYRHLM